MQFDHAYALARQTPSAALSEAWQTCLDEATRCIQGKRPMTIREAGALAELHNMRLEDVLSI